LNSTGAPRTASVSAQAQTEAAGAAGQASPAMGVVGAVNPPAPGAASPSMETTDYGMTIKQPTVEKPQTPPDKPVYIKLIDNLQAMWRASGNAVDVVAEASKATAPATLVQGPLVYPDPKTKKVSNN
jgi:hypothetical protein